MDNITDIHNNYDAVFKESFLLYKDKSLDFLGLHIAPIAEPLNTEHTEVELKKTYSDLLFKLLDNTGLHMEWEADISHDDMLRFLSYNVDSSRSYKMPFITVIFTNKAPSVTSYVNQSVKYTPTIINLGERDGDALLAEIKRKLEAGEPVNELEVVYLPLYNSSSKTVVQFLEEVVALAPRISADREHSQKMILLSALLTNKFISDSEYAKLWEGIKMVIEELKLFQFARADAIAEERRSLAKKLLQRGESLASILELVEITEDELKELQTQAVG